MSTYISFDTLLSLPHVLEDALKLVRKLLLTYLHVSSHKPVFHRTQFHCLPSRESPWEVVSVFHARERMRVNPVVECI